MDWLKRSLAAAGIAAGAYVAISALMAQGLTRARKTPLGDSPSSLGLAYETVTFPSRDGRIDLKGWLIPPPGIADMREAESKQWAVMVHGYSSNRSGHTSGLLPLARDLHSRGFGILMFDQRASGESSGRRSSAGFYERLDLLGALDYLAERGADRAKTGVIGQSLGGAVALMVCSEPGVAGAVVADSAFADLWMMIGRSQRGRRKPLTLMNPGMSLAARLLYGVDINEVSPVHSLAVSDTPVMLIHGADDLMVPREQAELLSRAAKASSTNQRLWIVEGAAHSQAYRTKPVEYVDRVTEFFRASLKA